MDNVFKKLGISERPIMLAPLAGVSDHPFRRTCARYGADLTYVEMLSATALSHKSPRTLEMAIRHPEEKILGVQVTSKCPKEMATAVELLNDMPFDTIDINMGCPVKKVVKVGCGSAILKDPKRVYETTLAARKATEKPLSVKIRLGWTQLEKNYLDVLKAAEDGGAEWITVHGRTRSDDYSTAVDLNALAELKQKANIPVIGNGNVFCKADADRMMEECGLDGVMVSRGALGNPFVFREIKEGGVKVSLDEWLEAVTQHLKWQQETYGQKGFSAVCMRKHILWYAKGWPGVRRLRDQIVRVDDNSAAIDLIAEFGQVMRAREELVRRPLIQDNESRFAWDPKWEMDRKLDRGVGDDGLEVSQ